MKTIVYRTNIGLMDAKKLGLDHTKCRQGDSASVSDELADSLVKSGKAVLESDAKHDPLIQSALGVEKKGDQCQKLPTDPPEEISPAVKGQAKKPDITAPAK